MRFRKLIVKNLASIEYAVLDFEQAPLANSPIFLICGDTGSGKSTLLDAVCLALYDASPRFKSSSADKFKLEGVFGDVTNNDATQILRKNASEGSSELVFEGNDGHTYTAVWKLRLRKKRNSAEVEILREWNLHYWESGSPDPLTLDRVGDIEKKIAAAVGLTYEQFCRTSLLAQGEFTKFLKSNDTEKADILEKLTDTAQFARVGSAIYAKMNQRRAALEDLQKEISLTRVMTEEELAEKLAEKERLAARLTETAREAESVQKKKLWIDKDAELKKRMQEAETALKKAQERIGSNEYKNAKQILQNWEFSEDARNWLNQSRAQEEEIKLAAAVLERKRGDFSVLLGGVEVVKNFMAGLEAEITRLERELENGSGDRCSEAVLARYKDALAAAERFSDKTSAADKTAREQASLEQQCAVLQRSAAALTEQAAKAEENLAKALAVLESVRKGVDDAAKGLRAQLKPGDDCPVCGHRIEHLLTDEFFEKLYAPAKQGYDAAERQNKEAQRALNKHCAELKAKTDALVPLKKRREEEMKEQGEARAALTAILQELWGEPALVAEPEIPALRARLQQETEILAKRLETARLLEKKRNDLVKCREECERDTALTSSVAEYLGEVPVCAEPKPVQGLNKCLADLQGEVKACCDRRQRAEQMRSRLSQQLGEFYAAHPQITSGQLAALAGEKENIEHYKRFCKTAEDALTAAQTAQKQYADEQARHSGQKPEIRAEDTPESLASASVLLQQSTAELNRQTGALEQYLKLDAENRKLQSKKAEQLAALQTEFEQWERLNKLFGDATGNKFRKIVLNYMMDELLSYANGHLMQLSSRYRLESSFGSFAVLVRDLHDGGSLRPASSLSGGESFLVSLALALGLSSFSGSRITTDILFIDEGFGTLSGNALEPAIAALERLQQSFGRKVGIISHVPALRERIKTQIYVERTDPTRSHVTVM